MLCQACRGILEQERDFLGWAYPWEHDPGSDTSSSDGRTSPEQPRPEPSTGVIDVPIGDLRVSCSSSTGSVEWSDGDQASTNSEKNENDQDEDHQNEDEQNLSSNSDVEREETSNGIRRLPGQERKPYEAAKHGHHRTFSEFQKALHDWCQVCRKLWDTLSLFERQSVQNVRPQESSQNSTEIPYLTYAYVSEEEDSVDLFYYKVQFNRNVVGSTAAQTWASFDLIAHTEDQAPQREVASQGDKVIWHDTLSPGAIGLARQWLTECLDHSTCSKANALWYPTRLLDIRADILGKADGIRLVHTEDLALDQPYTTLSHRWGGISLLQLTRDNIHSFGHAIAVAEMPRTFQEAIYVSRELGVRYIWIDSLCIIQDKEDLSDWAREASQMHKVYANSYCNLSASDAMDSSEGLSRKCPPTFVDPTVINFKSRINGEDRHRDSVYALRDNVLFDKDVNECALNKRGWVLQERFLAPRVLHFCRYQLFWECRSRAACETYPSGLPLACSREDIVFKTAEHSTGNTQAFWYKSWQYLVLLYSNAFLTFPDDKLTALSGLAKRVRSAVDDTYVAGMWRKDLEHHLLWLRYWYFEDSPDSNHSLLRSHKYRAPSWSWASLDGQILANAGPQTASDVFRLDIHVEDVRLQYTSDDDTGQLTGGWLHLSGRLKPVRLLCDTRKKLRSTQRWSISFEGAGKDPNPLVYLDEPLTDETVMAQHSENGDFFCMPVVPAAFDGWTMTEPEGEEDEFVRSYRTYYARYEGSFLLFRLIDRSTNEFQRIGLGTALYDGIDPLHKELDEEIKQSLPCLRYENGRHTIRIL